MVVAILRGSILEPLNQRLLDSKHVLSDGVKGLVIWCVGNEQEEKQRMHEKKIVELCKLRESSSSLFHFNSSLKVFRSILN